jgi:hypothetical protein
MCNEHGESMAGRPQARQNKMKATLEFNYPEDEDALRYAVHGEKAIKALWDVKRYIRDNFVYNSNAIDVLNKVREITDLALAECGEEV